MLGRMYSAPLQMVLGEKLRLHKNLKIEIFCMAFDGVFEILIIHKIHHFASRTHQLSLYVL